MVLIEAMAANTAIVASGLDGYRNVATDDVDAIWSSRATSTPSPSRLKRVLFEPGLSSRLQQAGSRRAEDFSMTALAAALRRALHPTVDESPDAGTTADPGVLLAELATPYDG